MNVVNTLLDNGIISPEQMAEARALHQAKGLRLDRALVYLGHVTPQQILQALGRELDIPFVDLSEARIDAPTLQCLPARLAYRKQMIPIERTDKQIKVATSDPFDLYAFDEIRLMTGLEVKPVLAVEDEIVRLIKTHYGVGGDTIHEMVGADEEGISAVEEDSTDLMEMAQEASVIKLVNEIFIEAINERASDIHIEPYENDLKIRYRIDGLLHETAVPPQIKQFQQAIISRIKIMANLNIAEKRLPQDGRIKLQISGHQVDIRVSVIPMLFGEGVVLRILDKANVLFTLPQLGMDERDFATFNTLISQPHGIILVTGPTGSGKTTTLYAALSAIVGPSKKVITVEDPVEYHLAGINQIQTHHKIGLTFAAGLRSILRHDPDVIMIGEIRDLETAEAAIQAALTGHLVFSTLHTNDATSAPMRLVDMGVEPYLVASTLQAAMAQRLVRTICPQCKQAYDWDRDRLPPDVPIEAEDVIYHGAGCKHCRQSGYRGRMGIFELMVTTHEINELIMERASTGSVIEVARSAGMRTLREDGWAKVKMGLTTPEEVLRCTQG